jgi:hypothetical protein
MNAPSHQEMNSVVDSLNARAFYRREKRARVALKVIDHELDRLGGSRFIGPRRLVSILEWEDQVLSERLGSILAADCVRNRVCTSCVCKGSVCDVPVRLGLAPIH